MNKEDLIEFLRDNLKIAVSHESATWNESERITVSLILGGETISEEYTYVFNS